MFFVLLRTLNETLFDFGKLFGSDVKIAFYKPIGRLRGECKFEKRAICSPVEHFRTAVDENLGSFV